jgi:hypothetical protein
MGVTETRKIEVAEITTIRPLAECKPLRKK